jgi:tight adherence protein C
MTLPTALGALLDPPTRAAGLLALVAALGAAAWMLLRERRAEAVRARLAAVLDPERAPAADTDNGEPPADPQRPGLAALVERLVAPLPLVGAEEQARIRLRLTRAGRRRGSVPLFLAAKLALTAALGGVGLFFALVHPALPDTAMATSLAVLAGAAAGAVVPELVLRSRGRERQAKINAALPDALDLLVICAEAGLSLGVAVDRVARELGGAAPELADELDLLAAELRLLPERQTALDNLAERTDLPAVRSLVATLSQAQKYGTSLAQSMRVISAEVRQQRMLSVEERAARIPAMISVPLILFILPSIFLVVAGPAALQVLEMM